MTKSPSFEIHKNYYQDLGKAMNLVSTILSRVVVCISNRKIKITMKNIPILFLCIFVLFFSNVCDNKNG